MKRKIEGVVAKTSPRCRDRHVGDVDVFDEDGERIACVVKERIKSVLRFFDVGDATIEDIALVLHAGRDPSDVFPPRSRNPVVGSERRFYVENPDDDGDPVSAPRPRDLYKSLDEARKEARRVAKREGLPHVTIWTVRVQAVRFEYRETIRNMDYEKKDSEKCP